MMLYVDGCSCPIEGSPKLPTLFAIDSLTDPQQAMQGQVLELEIPSTAASDAIFGVARDIYAAQRFNDSHHTAVVVCEGVELFEGTIYILSSTMAQRHGGSYRVRIAAGGADWAKRAARTTLRSSGLEFETTLTAQSIMDSWSGSKDVRFLPVLRNRYSPIYSGYSGAPVEYIMTADDFHPYFSLAALLERIFDGYTIEGDFINSSELRQLYISGQYASPDTIKQRALLDFFARRKDRATAVADEWGMVYATESFDGDSALGNIVDTADPTAVDCDGAVMHDTFTTGKVFTINEEGYCQFTSTIAATVGFLLHLKYTTDYRIASRTSLCGFNRVVAEPDVDVSFTLANVFEDQREKLVGGIEYSLCIFDYVPDNLYLLTVYDADSGSKLAEHVVESRFSRITMPEGCTPHCTLELMSGEKEQGQSDWALYFGYVEECGKTEVIVDLRIPPQDFAPEQTMRFNRIKFGGAEQGMEITLSTECSLRPYFSTVPGYGSTVTFADISHTNIWLIELVDALCRMFNLVIHTDEKSRRVRIEPMESFYSDKVWEWSDRVDFSSPITISDMGVDVPHTLEWGYRSGDWATEQFNELNNTQFGVWQVENGTYGAKSSTRRNTVSLFTTGINRTGHYALAPSASIMQVGDSAAEGSMDAPFTTHIVRYVGLRPLPEGERWGYPLSDNRYPLSAFFFPGDRYTEGFSLCYEDREGIAGLNRFFKDAVARLTTRQRLSLSLHLTPAELARLLSTEENSFASLSDNFRLDILGESSLYRIESLQSYDAERQSAKCTLIRLTKD
ncbi:MAG: hypothetical protein IJX65_00420 [Alistipes sp.]|nr:hypothetical protein [Alistipes sp.]